MALQKRVTNAALVAGVHTLTLDSVTGLEIGYPIRVAGVSLDNYDGRHVIAGIDVTAKTITWTQGSSTLASAAVTGLVDVEVLWAEVEDVLGFLGVEPASESDELFLEQSVLAGNEWCFERRRISGYDDLPNAVPNPSVKMATVLMCAALYRERGSVESFQSYSEFPTSVPIGGGLGQIQRLLGVNKPRIA